MKEVREDTHWCRIYMSGSIEDAKRLLRAEAEPGGLCVTIDPTHFIYKQGEEAGFVVGLLNYPRFPALASEIDAQALRIARLLRAHLHQASVLVTSPLGTTWITDRE